MRFSPLTLAFALTFAALSTVSDGQSQAPINPMSIELVKQGRAAESAANYDVAIDSYESALVADPRNREAYLGLASVARAQGLPGKAIAIYKDVLLLDPNDTDALGGLGLAYVDKGAIAQANQTLTRLDELCKSECAGQQPLRAALAAKEQTAQVAQPLENKPIVSEEKPDGS